MAARPIGLQWQVLCRFILIIVSADRNRRAILKKNKKVLISGMNTMPLMRPNRVTKKERSIFLASGGKVMSTVVSNDGTHSTETETQPYDETEATQNESDSSLETTVEGDRSSPSFS